MKLKKIVTGFVAAAMMVTAVAAGSGGYSSFVNVPDVVSAAPQQSAMYECFSLVWTPISGAEGYNVYIKPEGGSYTQIDSMLIRQYSDGYFHADAVGLKAGSYIMKVVPVIGGKEDSSKATETPGVVSAYDRTGFGWVNGTSSGAYNEDGTLKDNARVIYITEDTKNTVTLEVTTSSKGTTTTGTGLQEIFNLYKKGYEKRPLAVRIIGQVTDPATLINGDLTIDGGEKVNCGITIEGIGHDATINGFGIRIKNITNCEIRNLGVMLVDSGEGDNVTLQQGCDHVWVHNCDFFYGMPGSDKDQAKGDGALDCKLSTYVTFSYNHFWDSGKCNLLGLKESTTEGYYITYHHNWYDHSDSRHPRVRFYSAHVYNNYYDGNSKYGMGSTLGSSLFSENNYFRNCKYPMLTSMQGSDIATGKGTFSSEDGGTIKAFGNYMTGQKAFVPYSENNTEFDAYVVSSKDEKVPSTVKSKQGSNTYNNFDTNDSVMYKWTADPAEKVPEIVMAGAGRQGGGDFSFTFDNSKDDEDYGVNQALMTSLKNYKSSVIAIGSGFKSDVEPVTTTTKATTKATANVTTGSATKSTTTKSTNVTNPVIPVTGKIIYCSPDGKSSAAGTQKDPMDVLTAISKVEAGGLIYLLDGTYKFDKTIVIDNNNNGSAGKFKSIMAYPGANVVWDFSALAVGSSARGLVLDGSYWNLKGFEITKAGDNGLLLSGNNNRIELMEFTDNQDSGLQISRYRTDTNTIAQWPTNNLVLNCTARNNCDDKTMENADGFAAKLTCGEGNVFDGCMSYNNSDDGWDLYAKTETGPIGVVTIRNCVAFRNGYTEFGEGFGDCDGNGFKLGGSGVGTAHVVENCLAFENLNCGFTDNNNPKLGNLTDCTAYNNGMGGNGKPNFSCYRCTDDGCDFKNVLTYINASKISASFPGGEANMKVANDKFVGTIENSVYYNSKYYNVKDKANIENGGKIGDVVTPTDDMFVSLEVAPYVKNSSNAYDFHTEWRNADGSINTHGFCEVKETSEFAALGAKFEAQVPPVPTLKGDLDNDKDVDVTDIVLIQKFLIKVSKTATKAYDVNEDGKINVFDFVVLKHIVLSQAK